MTRPHGTAKQELERVGADPKTDHSEVIEREDAVSTGVSRVARPHSAPIRQAAELGARSTARPSPGSCWP